MTLLPRMRCLLKITWLRLFTTHNNLLRRKKAKSRVRSVVRLASNMTKEDIYVGKRTECLYSVKVTMLPQVTYIFYTFALSIPSPETHVAVPQLNNPNK